MGKALTLVGGLGASVGLLCCFTSVLPAVLTALGASGLIATLYRDSVLLSFVGVSLVLLGVGLWLKRRARD